MKPIPGKDRRGFTLLEIVMIAGIVGLLAALALPKVAESRAQGFNSRAIADLAMLASELQAYDPLPATLADIGRDQYLDPWGNPYQYLPIRGTGNGGFRKDGNLVPINSDFDLYSLGPDGRSVGPLTAQVSRDDIVRANNGGFVGLASEY